MKNVANRRAWTFFVTRKHGEEQALALRKGIPAQKPFRTLILEILIQTTGMARDRPPPCGNGCQYGLLSFRCR